MLQLRLKLDAILRQLVIGLFTLMLLCVVWQVIARTFAIASTFTDEIARLMFIWLGLMGAAYAHGQKRHLAIDLLVRNLSGWYQRYLQYCIHGLVIIFVLLVMVYGGGRLVWNTWSLGQHSPTIQLPMWIVYLSLPLSGIGIMFYSVCDVISMYRKLTQ